MNAVCLIVALGIGQAAGSAPADAAQLNKLISQLGSGQFSERQAAGAALEKLGAAAVPALRQAKTNPDLEVRRRAETLLARIERRLESACLLAGKQIELSYRDMPVEEAWQDFSKRTGFILTPDKDRPPDLRGIVNLKTGPVSTWAALEQFCQACGFAESGSTATGTDGPGIVLRAGKPERLPTCYAGGVRVRALVERAPGWGQTPGVTELPVVLQIAAEPGIAWQGTLGVHIERTIDERGQGLEQAVPGSDDIDAYLPGNDVRWLMRMRSRALEPEARGEQGPWSRHTVRLKTATEPSHALKEMRGTIVARVQTPIETLVKVESVLKAEGKTFTGADGYRLKIAEITQGDDGVVKIAVEYEAAFEDGLVMIGAAQRVNNRFRARLRAQMGATASPAIELQDAAGHVFEAARYNEASESDGTHFRYTSTIHFLPKADFGAASQLILTGRRTVTVELPFTLHDVPLP
jgi:hypothetical protein